MPGRDIRDGCEAPCGCWELTEAPPSENKHIDKQTKPKQNNFEAVEMAE